LTDVTIGKGLTSLSDSAFSHCYSLKNIKVDENNPAFTDIDGVLFSKDKKNLVRYPCKRYGNYNIPDGVTSVKSQAFAYCYNLKSITIPDSVTFIVPGAFYGSYLKKVYKPVTATWEYSFDKNVEIIPVYKVTYKLYDEIIAAEYAELNQKANLLTSPDRYRYGYTVNGQKWDGVVKDNTIVTVTLLPNPIVSLIPEIVLQAESIKENSIHCIYKINVESDMALTGNFIIGIYDSSNRLVAHETHTITDKTEYFAEGVIESDVKATTYKIFLWRDLSELETLSPVLEGTIQ